MKYRELVKLAENDSNWFNLGDNEGFKLICKIVQKSFGKISFVQALKIVSNLSDLEVKYLSEYEKISIITNPYEMAENLKVYDFECEEPPSPAYWKVEYPHSTKKSIKVLYGNCIFTKILQKFKYIGIYNVTLDSEEILEECDFELEEVLVVLVTKPAHVSTPSSYTMYIYIPS